MNKDGFINYSFFRLENNLLAIARTHSPKLFKTSFFHLPKIVQKQPPEVFYKKGFLKKIRKIHRKIPVSESPF